MNLQQEVRIWRAEESRGATRTDEDSWRLIFEADFDNFGISEVSLGPGTGKAGLSLARALRANHQHDAPEMAERTLR